MRILLTILFCLPLGAAGAVSDESEEKKEPALTDEAIRELTSEKLDDVTLRLLSNVFENQENAERCVDMRRIDRTHILDDKNVLFYMRGGDIYLNHMPRRCNGLRTADTFMYRTSGSRLCDLDMITKLDRFGSRFQPGISCGLGLFTPVEKEVAKKLRKGMKNRKR